jgi:hypothetical protein
VPEPIKITPAPKDWKLNPDQASRLAGDPALRRMTRDEQYHYFNNRQKGTGKAGPNTAKMKHDASAIHPARLLNYVGNAYKDAVAGKPKRGYGPRD